MYLNFYCQNIDRGNNFQGASVGIAFRNSMCGSYSVCLVKDFHFSTRASGSIFAHEIGHILNMEHDSGTF